MKKAIDKDSMDQMRRKSDASLSVDRDHMSEGVHSPVSNLLKQFEAESFLKCGQGKREITIVRKSIDFVYSRFY